MSSPVSLFLEERFKHLSTWVAPYNDEPSDGEKAVNDFAWHV